MNDSTFQPEPGSFRDRLGRVYVREDAIYRGLSEVAWAEWELLAKTKFFKAALESGAVIPTEETDAIDVDTSDLPAPWSGYLRHERLSFVTYAYEWPFDMLKDAALQQLDLMERALAEDMVLKDATPYNTVFRGVQPVFIDIPSFEKLKVGDPWIGYRQFCEMFLYPLMLQAYKDIPYRFWLRGRVDGIDPADCNAMMSLRDLFRPGVLTNVYLQSKLVSAFSDSSRSIKKEVADAGFSKELIKVNVKKMKKLVSGLTWNKGKTEWSDYAQTHSYDDENFEKKIDFVRRASVAKPRKLSWDIGCNTGTFSKILAEHAETVVAMDIDPLAVQKLYNELRHGSEAPKNIIPIINNIADASPGVGWRGLERKRLEERGRPDLTICLALIHHVVISAHIPLYQFVAWLASLGTDLVIEMVTKDDAMVKKLLLNKDDIYNDYEVGFLEDCLATHFVVEERMPYHNDTRILYYATQKK
ncbi:MAG: methyltransferase [Candidatus Hydrogenedentota bacterium]